jgi:extracellular factor (EF) 3-hydroxypalmitic acid methyl ester biosynthesis protein
MPSPGVFPLRLNIGQRGFASSLWNVNEDSRQFLRLDCAAGVEDGNRNKRPESRKDRVASRHPHSAGCLDLKSSMRTATGGDENSLAVFRTSQGTNVRATLLRLTRYAAVCEVYNPDTVIRTSEALDGFKISINDQPVYSGRAVVRDSMNTGTLLVCSVDLDDFSFDAEFLKVLSRKGQFREQFDDFVKQWQGVCRVLPAFKVAVADIQTFLIDLRRWLETVELGIRSSPGAAEVQKEQEVITELSPQVILVIDALFEKFENIAAGLEEGLKPVHRSYVQRHLLSIVLCAPFAWRCYQKPLGHAGDYEMVNMMLRDPREGSSLFAKMFNVWLLHQGSAAAHRNRVNFLKQRLVATTAASVRAGRSARILSLGCGPAWEVQEFLAESELSNSAHFTLLDFSEETLRHTAAVLGQRQRENRRATSIKLVKKSVQQLLKDVVNAGPISKGNTYDFIYCAGLLDYLPDRTSKRLMMLLYQWLGPGGLLVATNVTPMSPNRGSLELILDWHLIYRDAAQMAALRPEGAGDDAFRILSDGTGINVFLETTKSNGD